MQKWAVGVYSEGKTAYKCTTHPLKFLEKFTAKFYLQMRVYGKTYTLKPRIIFSFASSPPAAMLFTILVTFTSQEGNAGGKHEQQGNKRWAWSILTARSYVRTTYALRETSVRYV